MKAMADLITKWAVAGLNRPIMIDFKTVRPQGAHAGYLLRPKPIAHHIVSSFTK